MQKYVGNFCSHAIIHNVKTDRKESFKVEMFVSLLRRTQLLHPNASLTLGCKGLKMKMKMKITSEGITVTSSLSVQSLVQFSSCGNSTPQAALRENLQDFQKHLETTEQTPGVAGQAGARVSSPSKVSKVRCQSAIKDT